MQKCFDDWLCNGDDNTKPTTTQPRQKTRHRHNSQTKTTDREQTDRHA